MIIWLIFNSYKLRLAMNDSTKLWLKCLGVAVGVVSIVLIIMCTIASQTSKPTPNSNPQTNNTSTPYESTNSTETNTIDITGTFYSDTAPDTFTLSGNGSGTAYNPNNTTEKNVPITYSISGDNITISFPGDSLGPITFSGTLSSDRQSFILEGTSTYHK